MIVLVHQQLYHEASRYFHDIPHDFARMLYFVVSTPCIFQVYERVLSCHHSQISRWTCHSLYQLNYIVRMNIWQAEWNQILTSSLSDSRLCHTHSWSAVLVMFSSGLCPSSLTVTAGVGPDLRPLALYHVRGRVWPGEGAPAGPASLASHVIQQKIMENILWQLLQTV